MQHSFRNLDLNLLKTLVVLYQEKNTRRAAERLFTTQPSVSRALNKLRDHFQEELFIRNQYGLTPTPTGDEICLQVTRALQFLEDSVSLTAFSPQSVDGRISVGLNHFMAEAYATTLYRRIAQLAPNLQLEVESWTQSSLNKLVNGELDFGVNYLGIETPSDISTTNLGAESFALYMRKDHPFLGDTSLEALSKYPLACALIPNWNQKESRIEQILRQHKVAVNVVLRSENVHSIMKVLNDGDLIFPGISGLVDDTYQPNLVSVPIESITNVPTVDFTRCIFSHQKNRDSEFHQWFLAQLEEVLAKNS